MISSHRSRQLDMARTGAGPRPSVDPFDELRASIAADRKRPPEARERGESDKTELSRGRLAWQWAERQGLVEADGPAESARLHGKRKIDARQWFPFGHNP